LSVISSISWLPYLTLSSGVDVLPPSTEASSGPKVHPQINHKVTKSPSVVLTWIHTNNGTIRPASEETHLGSPTITHSQYLQENKPQAHINPGHNDLQIRNQENLGDPPPNQT